MEHRWAEFGPQFESLYNSLFFECLNCDLRREDDGRNMESQWFWMPPPFGTGNTSRQDPGCTATHHSIRSLAVAVQERLK